MFPSKCGWEIAAEAELWRGRKPGNLPNVAEWAEWPGAPGAQFLTTDGPVTECGAQQSHRYKLATQTRNSWLFSFTTGRPSALGARSVLWVSCLRACMRECVRAWPSFVVRIVVVAVVLLSRLFPSVALDRNNDHHQVLSSS